MRRDWRKLGRLYSLPEGGLHPQLRSHASNPVPMLLEGDVYRVFYSSRDAANRSSVGAVDIDIVRRKVVTEHSEPFIEYGAEGTFYESGISLGNYYDSRGVCYLLFMGWQNPPGGHWRGDIGRLVVQPDLTFDRESIELVMQSDERDPISLSYPWVLRDQDGLYKMWYGSTVSWDVGNGEMLHIIKSAASSDGTLFAKSPEGVPYLPGVAQAFSRPTVIGNLQQGYEMWFSYRSGTGTTYRIGRAVSRDGKAWSLSLESGGLEISNEGWDSEMVEYPYVFEHKGVRYMLYNGNGYGKSGFGLAEGLS